MFGSYVPRPLARHRMLASQFHLARQLHSRFNSPPFHAKLLLVRGQLGSPSLLTHIPRNTFTRRYSTQPSPKERSSILSRIFPSLQSSPETGSSLRKVVALAKPEKKPLLFAICLLLVSSSVSMSVPFAIGKLIDYFSSTNPVSVTPLRLELHCPCVDTFFYIANTLWTFFMASIWDSIAGVHDWCYM